MRPEANLPDAQSLFMPPPPDDTELLRGMPFDRNAFEASVRRHFKAHGIHGLSVWGMPGVTPSEVVRQTRAAGLDLRGERIRVTTVGRVRGAGLSLSHDHSWHYLIVFPAKPTASDWAMIDGLFGPERDAIREGE